MNVKYYLIGIILLIAFISIGCRPEPVSYSGHKYLIVCGNEDLPSSQTFNDFIAQKSSKGLEVNTILLQDILDDENIPGSDDAEKLHNYILL